MNRAFKEFTIQAGGTPQPVVGTYLTSPITAAQVAGLDSKGNNPRPITVAVADSSMFVQGDWAVLVDPVTFAMERVQVTTTPGSSTTVSLIKVHNAHPGGAYGTGAWLALGATAQSVFIQGIAGDTGILFIGDRPQMIKAGLIWVFFQLYPTASAVNPYTFSSSRQGLAFTETLSSYWIDGTTGDGYLPSIGVP